MSVNHIAIEGAIGIGKTSLAQRLASDLGAKLLLEPVNEIPFIEKFYHNTQINALSTQLSFFMQRLEQIESINQQALFTQFIITDYIWQKDALFAEYTLTDDEFTLYQNISKRLSINVPVPDLVIYLQAPIETLMMRIEKRNRIFERPISYQYLEGLYEKYIDFFYHYNDSPLLIINASNIDWVNNSADYQVLKDNVLNPVKGRHFLNFDSQEIG